MLGRHPGHWRLSFWHPNQVAARFWPGVVAAIADGAVESDSEHPPEVVRAETTLRFRFSAYVFEESGYLGPL